MKTKKKLLIEMFLVLIMLSIPTVVNASVFYDLSGSTDVGWASNGVSIYAQSSTTDYVDLIQVLSRIYVNGYYQGFLISSRNDAVVTSVSATRSYYGDVDVITQHDADDWTGDEQVYTSDSYYR